MNDAMRWVQSAKRAQSTARRRARQVQGAEEVLGAGGAERNGAERSDQVTASQMTLGRR
jgi:hypothetical protein